MSELLFTGGEQLARQDPRARLKPGCRLDPGVKGTVVIGIPLDRRPISVHFQRLALELNRIGYRAVVLSPPTAERDSVEIPGLEVDYWPSARPTRLADGVFCWRLFRRLRPQCIIAHFGADNWMLAAGAAMRIPVRIGWYHTLTSQIEMDGQSAPLRLRLVRLRKRWVYKWATQVVANSAAASRDLISSFSVPARKCRIFNNSVPDPFWESGGPRCAEPPTARLICVGRHDWSKGHDVLIRAFPRILSSSRDCVLEFFGEGRRLADLRQLSEALGVAGRVRFHGRVPHEQVMKELGRGGILVHPSRSEAFGVALVEGMAFGLPIVSTAVGGIVDVVENGVSGLLVRSEDDGELSCAINSLLRDASLRERLASGARKQFLEKFEQTAVVGKQVQWLQTLLSQPFGITDCQLRSATGFGEAPAD